METLADGLDEVILTVTLLCCSMATTNHGDAVAQRLELFKNICQDVAPRLFRYCFFFLLVVAYPSFNIFSNAFRLLSLAPIRPLLTPSFRTFRLWCRQEG